MSSKKTSSKPSKSKNADTAVQNGDVVVPTKMGIEKSSAGDGEEKHSKLKVEMKTLFMSLESENILLDTMKELHGKNFNLLDISAYRDKGENLSKQYWMDRGHLIVQGGIDYSAKPKDEVSMEERVNTFALSRLQGYGFHRNHCVEALQLTEGDVGVALEVLASCYFNVGARFPKVKKLQTEDDEDEDETSSMSDVEFSNEQKAEEKCVLESIYESLFEEHISNRVWILHLDLRYLLDVYIKPEKPPEVAKSKSKPKKESEVCRFFMKGHCKFTNNCRYSHELPELAPAKKKSGEEEKFIFNLEIRFPEGSRYPAEAALVYLTSTCPKVPPEACLRLSRRLQEEALECARSETPCVYTVTQLLLEHPEKMLDILKIWRGDFPCSDEKLFPDVRKRKSMTHGDQDADNNNTGLNLKGGQHNGKNIQNMKEIMRENSKIMQKFFEKQDSCPKYRKMVELRSHLPAWKKCEEIIEAVEESQVVVISGETGCGKSTQVPQFLLDQWLTGGSNDDHREIVCTQPRRISAIGVAERVAEERVDKVGNVVGYQIRLESKTSSLTRLLFCTTGILLRRLEGDPNLTSVSHVIVDEVHERSEESDFLLMILRDLLQVRKDLKVILMSATLNANLFSNYFGKVPVIEIPGRTFPVTQYFLEDVIEEIQYALEENSQYCREIKKGFSELESLEVQLAIADQKTAVIPNPVTRDEHLTIAQMYHRYDGFSNLTKKSLYLMDPEKINYDLIECLLVWIVNGSHKFPRTGSILVFLPGLAEIQTLFDQLNESSVVGSRTGKFLLLPLHSTLSSEEQAAIFRKPKASVRKIILSTNIAETSVTIDDCVFVIDCGKMKEKRFDSNRNMESLELVWVSQANALQRKGRAGRVMPGVCFHLFTQHRFDYHFLKQPIPELHRVPLEQLILRIKTLLLFAHLDVHAVLGRTLEPPPSDSIDSALQRLKDVGAMDLQNNLTALGRHLAALPVDVRIGKLIIFGAIFCCVDSALTIAACLSYKSPFVAPFGKKDLADNKKKEFAVGNSDQLTVLKAYKVWQKQCSISRLAGQNFVQENFLSWRTLVMLGDIKQQLLELLASIGFVSPDSIRKRRSGNDQILTQTGPELNANGENNRLLVAILCAALYPQVVQVLTPEKSYTASATGAVPKQLRACDLRFKTRDDGFVFLHPSSINYTVTHFASPYLVYQEKVKTSRVFIRDTSMVPLLPLVLFSGCGLTVELIRGDFVLALADGWIRFLVEKHKVAELIKMIRSELVDLLAKKIEDPSLDLLTHERGKKVVRTIIHLVTKG